MKKTVTVNLNGRVFTMDEDAYQLLDKYLNNIRIYFRKEEGSAEIIADFEARIEELFSERIRLGQEVISIELVEEVISRVGKPDDFEDDESGKRGTEEENRKEERQNFQQSFQQAYQQVKKSFFRNEDNKMLGGICSGLAAYFDWDVLAVRIIAIVLMFASSFAIVPIYLLAWIIFPAAKTATEKLQMQGMPITVENIGKTVAAKAEPAKKQENRGCLEGFIEIIVAIMKIVLIGVGCLILLPVAFALVIVIIALFAALFGIGGGLLGIIPFSFIHDPSIVTFDHPLLASISFMFFIGIPLVVLIYSIVASIAKFKPVDKSVKWIILLVWIISLLLLVGSGFRIHQPYWDLHVTQIDGFSDTEQEYIIDQPFETIKMEDGFIGDVKIEQTPEGTPATIKISGNEFWVNRIRHQVDNDQLRISFSGEYKLRSIRFWKKYKRNDLIVRINTPGVKRIQSGAVGNILIPGAFIVDDLNLAIKGVGKFQADSLYVYSLKAYAEGVGSMILGGQAQKAEFGMEGTGSINAFELVADSVFANVEGIGSVKVNPIDYLKGKVNGIGSLTYKEEPREKNTEMSGIGRIGKK